MLVPAPVTTVAEARTGLSRLLARFRDDPSGAQAMVIGSHRKPEAVIMSYMQFRSATVPAAGLTLLEVVKAKRALVARLAALNHIGAVSVFGSVARQTETAASDIDLLVDPDDESTLFDLAQFEIDLEAVFDRRVDAVSRRSLGDGDAEILREAIPL